MKKFLRKILVYVLSVLARRTVNRYQPIVIGVTGSVGKTTAKEAIASVLRYKYSVRKSYGNFNNEIGIPLAVLGIRPLVESSSTVNRIFQRVQFCLELIASLWLCYGVPKERYPQVLVLELAADRPGDIASLVKIVSPLVGVVTAVGEIPVHVEFYADPTEVAREKSTLIQVLPENGLAVLNGDDPMVFDMRHLARAPVMTFGLRKKGDVWASDISYFISDEATRVGGLSFKIHKGESFIPIRLDRLIGPHQVYGILAAAIVGLHFGMNLVEIASALEDFELPAGRMNLLRGDNHTLIIDDAYNASPISMQAALHTLNEFGKAMSRIRGKPCRTIAVLGDMKELGHYEREAHEAIGKLVPQWADVLITIGDGGKIIYDTAHNLMRAQWVMHFDTVEEIEEKLKVFIQEYDIILVKASHSMHLERVVDAIKMPS